MGTYISMSINPRRISLRGWEAVYGEALLLSGKLGLRDGIYRQCGDTCRYCEPEVSERILSDGTAGLCIRGISAKSGPGVEPVCIRRELNHYLKQAGTDDSMDILLAAQTEKMEKDGFSSPDYLVSVFHSKTLNREIHIAILAMACLFADRFPEAVTIGGDITFDQCRQAVRLANLHLEQKINAPVICRAEALLKRLAVSGISEERQLCAFMNLYLGEVTGEIKEHLLRRFPSDWILWYCRNYRSRSYWAF